MTAQHTYPAETASPPTRETLLRQLVEDVPQAPAFAALARFSYLAGAFFPTSHGAGPVVIHCEAGRLTFHVDKEVVLTRGGPPNPPQRIPPGSDFSITTGDQLLVPGDVPHTAKSEGPETAVTMGVAMFREAPVLQFPAGVDFHPLALGAAAALPSSPALAVVERVTLPARGRLASPPGAFRLCAIESGSVRVEVAGGGAAVTRGAGAAAVPGGAAPSGGAPAGGAPPAGGGPPPPTPLAPGTAEIARIADGLVLQLDADVAFEADSAATLLLARIEAAAVPADRAVAESFMYDAWDLGNTELVDTLFADGYVNHNPLAGQREGREGVKQLIRRFHEAFPDFSLSVDLIIHEGDRVACRYTFRGTHRGVFVGIQPTGKPVEITGITILRIANRRIVESWGYWEQITMLAQLGVIQLPTGGTSGGAVQW
jgi:steroid delta-isomerase-like uncharacterized protein